MRRISSLTAVVVAVIALGVGGAYFLITPTPAPTSSPSPTPTPMLTITPTAEEGPIRRDGPTITPEWITEDVTLAEARSLAPYTLKLPTWTAGYELKRVSIAAGGRVVYLLYSDHELADYDTWTMLGYNNDACYDDLELLDGVPEVILIVALQEEKIPAEDLEQHYRGLGWQFTTINGEPAYGKDELIRWWDGNVMYEVHGYHLTWSQLVRLAESTTPTITPTPSPVPTPHPAPPPMKVVSLEEAETLLGFKVPSPTYLPRNLTLRKAEVIAIEKPDYVELLYSDESSAITIIIHYSREEFDPRFIEGAIGGAISRAADACLTAVEVAVNGYPGFGREPGQQCDFDVFAPGVVRWWAGRFDCGVYSGQYPVEELLRVAESMEVGRGAPSVREVSLEEAGAVMGFRVPAPTYLPSNLSLTRVRVYAEEEFASILCSDESGSYLKAIHVYIRRLPGEPSPGYVEGVIEAGLDLAAKIGAEAMEVYVNGHPGFAMEPLMQETPGVVRWWVGRLECTVRGYFPLEELIKVAESMETRG